MSTRQEINDLVEELISAYKKDRAIQTAMQNSVYEEEMEYYYSALGPSLDNIKNIHSGIDEAIANLDGLFKDGELDYLINTERIKYQLGNVFDYIYQCQDLSPENIQEKISERSDCSITNDLDSVGVYQDNTRMFDFNCPAFTLTMIFENEKLAEITQPDEIWDDLLEGMGVPNAFGENGATFDYKDVENYVNKKIKYFNLARKGRFGRDTSVSINKKMEVAKEAKDTAKGGSGKSAGRDVEGR